jgi:hypothetical protein
MNMPGEPASPGHPHLPLDLRGAHVHHHLRGGHGRLRHRILIVFAIAFALIVGLAVLGAAVGAPKTKPLCRAYRPCRPPTSEPRLINQTVWRSQRYGFSLEYPGSRLTVSQQDAGSLTLQANLGDGATGTILVQGSAVGAGAPAQAISRQLANLTGVSQIGPDPDSAHQLFGSGVGYRPGAGQVSTGYFAAPQGVGQPVTLASEAASDGSITVSVTVGGPSGETGSRSLLYALGDEIINSIRWPADRSDSTPGSGAP